MTFTLFKYRRLYACDFYLVRNWYLFKRNITPRFKTATCDKYFTQICILSVPLRLRSQKLAFFNFRSGIYHLSLTVSVVPNAHVHVKMVKNSVNNEIGYVHQETEDHWQMSSTSVLVQLSAGDDVWCKCTELSSTVSGGNTYHSHFSGYFVTAT